VSGVLNVGEEGVIERIVPTTGGAECEVQWLPSTKTKTSLPEKKGQWCQSRTKVQNNFSKIRILICDESTVSI